jgi:hypothetical protein
VTTPVIVIYEPSASRHFSRMSALFEARATKERVLHFRECPEYVFSILFFETNIIMSDVSCKFSTSKLEKWRFVNQILLLSSQASERNLCPQLTVTVAKCHFEGM